MSILRVMTYAMQEPEATGSSQVAHIIMAQRPELVFLQHLTDGLLESLSKETGLKAYHKFGGCGFLSRYPISALRDCNLGHDGDCLRADLDLCGKRIHLFNVLLSCDPTHRGQQLARLFSEDMLGVSLPCATLIAGDFSFPLWGSGQWLLRRRLKPARHPAWGANFPSTFPLWPRDRFYLSGPLRSLAGHVVSTTESRKVSSHLPVITTLELTDTREFLKIPEVAEQRMRPATS